MQYWLCITSLANWDIIEKESLWAVKAQAQKRIKKVEPGDKLVFYVKSPVQAIAGIYEAVSKVYIDAEQLPWDDGPYPCRIRIRLVGKVRNLKGTFKERNPAATHFDTQAEKREKSLCSPRQVNDCDCGKRFPFHPTSS